MGGGITGGIVQYDGRYAYMVKGRLDRASYWYYTITGDSKAV